MTRTLMDFARRGSTARRKAGGMFARAAADNCANCVPPTFVRLPCGHDFWLEGARDG